VAAQHLKWSAVILEAKFFHAAAGPSLLNQALIRPEKRRRKQVISAQ
jgi:hypothetical protein